MTFHLGRGKTSGWTTEQQQPGVGRVVSACPRVQHEEALGDVLTFLIFGCGGKCVILFFGFLHRLQKAYIEKK